MVSNKDQEGAILHAKAGFSRYTIQRDGHFELPEVSLKIATCFVHSASASPNLRSFMGFSQAPVELQTSDLSETDNQRNL